MFGNGLCRIIWLLLLGSNAVQGGVEEKPVDEVTTHDFRAWTREFLTALNVELSVGGDSKVLEPILNFVQEKQEMPHFVKWIEYLARVAMASGVSFDTGSTRTPLNALTFLIQHLVADDNIDKVLKYMKKKIGSTFSDWKVRTRMF